MNRQCRVVVQGAGAIADVPQLEHIAARAEICFASTADELRAALPGAEILLGWDFRAQALREAWPAADKLRWIHWSGAGVDAALFPELAESAVTLTNARAIFDRAMAEYMLSLILAFAKRIPETVVLQQARTWKHRLTERIDGRTALIVGMGSIGRTTARLLRAAGMVVDGLGRRARGEDADFRRVFQFPELHQALALADYVLIVLPLTAETRGMFGEPELAAMRPGARLINVGRGPIVDEDALLRALETHAIRGAALDVFEHEPLPAGHPFWGAENLLLSPHMAGDFFGYADDLGWLFRTNFERFVQGRPLLNVVEKQRGY